jgi:hypothetical protein
VSPPHTGRPGCDMSTAFGALKQVDAGLLSVARAIADVDGY